MRPSKRLRRSGAHVRPEEDMDEIDDHFDEDDDGSGAAAVHRGIKRAADRAARRRRIPNRSAIAAASAAYHSSSDTEDDKNGDADRPSSAKQKSASKQQKTKKSTKTTKSVSDASSDDGVDVVEGLSDLDDEYDDDEIVAEKDQADVENSKSATKSRVSQFTSTLSQLLAPKLQPKTDQSSAKSESRPILSKKRQIEAEIDDAKLEARARRILSAEKKQRDDIGLVVPDHTTMEYEKQLRKLATRGVVQLFNAIRAAQKDAQELQADGVQKHAAEAQEVTKQTFIRTLKQEAEKKSSKPKPSSQSKQTGSGSAADNVSDTSSKNQKSTSKSQSKTKVTSAGVAEPTANESGPAVTWMASDYGMKAPKHWDQDDEDEDNVEF